MNGVPLGCTGRGRGVARGSGDLAMGRGRGRGITDGASNENLPGLQSLNLNGNKNGYKDDARTALQTATSRTKNEAEVVRVLEKWLDLAETDEDIGEAVATSVCEMMGHSEYGDVIRANVMTRVYTMYEECRTHKIKSISTLLTRFSFTGYIYLIHREAQTQKRISIYDKPMLLYIQAILTHKLTEDTLKILTKQISINGIALHSNPDNRAELDAIFISLRRSLLASPSPYLLYLVEIHAAGYMPPAGVVSKFYAEHIPEPLLKSYRPLEIDVKLYGRR